MLAPGSLQLGNRVDTSFLRGDAVMKDIIMHFARPDIAWVLFLVAGAVIGGVVAIVVTIANLYADNRRRRLSASAIADMVDRGFTADEIVDVLRAGGMEAGEGCGTLPREQAPAPANYA